MLGSHRNYANQYRSTGVSAAVLEADPHRLVALMLSGARDRIRLAGACLERGDIPRKAKAISDASGLILVSDFGGAAAAAVATAPSADSTISLAPRPLPLFMSVVTLAQTNGSRNPDPEQLEIYEERRCEPTGSMLSPTA